MDIGLFGPFDGGLVGEGDPGPISVAGGGPPVLAFHGFAGTPNEVRLVTEVAGRLGRRAWAPLLPGHGTNARDLQRTRWEDWTGAAEAALMALAPRSTDRVVVAGLSMGSLLATHLAASHQDRVAGLIVMANAAWLTSPIPTVPLVLLERSRLPADHLYAPKAGANICDPVARKNHLTYSANPLKAVIELLRGGRLVRAELGRVMCPVLVLHGAKDRVCPPANAERFAAGFGSRDVSIAFLPRSGHILTRDFDRDEVSARLQGFLTSVSTDLQRAATPVEP